MKYWFLFLSITTGISCNHTNAPSTNTTAEEITETVLPRGRYVLEDDVKTNTAQTGVLGDAKKAKTVVGENNSPQPVDAVNNFKHRFKNLLIFHANDTMKINKSYLATLILGKDQVLDDLKAAILETDGATGDNIKQDTSFEIGTKMKARLIDMSGAETKGFTIELIGGEDAATQSITEKRKKVIWQWKLTPQTPGLQELKLSINVIEKDGETVSLPARNIPVMIFAEQEGFLASIGSVLKNDNTKWLLSGILIPVLVGWYASRANKAKLAKNKENVKRKTKMER